MSTFLHLLAGRRMLLPAERAKVAAAVAQIEDALRIVDRSAGQADSRH